MKIPLGELLKNLALYIKSDTTIDKIKKKIENLVELPPYNKMEIIYAGIRLQDD